MVEACRPGHNTGSGALVAPGLVLTAAHVVAGAYDIEVVRNGRSVSAEVVAFDPDMDLAYLAVTGLGGRPLPVSSTQVAAGDTGSAYVWRSLGLEVLPVTVKRRINISTEDIYIENDTLRPGYELVADIEPGDSGGAVVIGGRVVGVLWARSRQADQRAYAIDPDRAGEVIRAQRRTGTIGDEIDIDKCP
ncbi:MAG TPA: trypsin-like peptidase domain-containing protein [Ilumatobacter sp.]